MATSGTVQHVEPSLLKALDARVWLLAIAVLLVVGVKASMPTLRRNWLLWQIPVVNKRPGEWTDGPAKKRYPTSARNDLYEGLQRFDGPFQIIGDFGRFVIIRPEQIEAIKSDARFSTRAFLTNFLKSDRPGFEGMRPQTTPEEPNMFIQMIRTKLTQNLAGLIEDLVDETAQSLKKVWGESTEWQEINVRNASLQIVARISARIFAGPELCNNQEWLDVTIRYTELLFTAQRALRAYPKWTHSVMHWFVPECRTLRACMDDARRIIQPVVDKRLHALEQSKQGKGEKPQDTIVWMHELANGRPYVAAEIQLALSVAALHTTSDLLSGILLNLCENPEWLAPMKQEVEEVNMMPNWQKTSLYHLKLMDSVMKETQRLKPIAASGMGRYTTTEVTLPDGHVIPEGVFVAASMQRMWDPTHFKDPDTFQADRYMQLRAKPGKENSAQFVTTGADHLGFGHGIHACPGRFLASNEIKLILADILTKYDFECADKEVPGPLVLGMEMFTNPFAKLRVKRKA